MLVIKLFVLSEDHDEDIVYYSWNHTENIVAAAAKLYNNTQILNNFMVF